MEMDPFQDDYEMYSLHPLQKKNDISDFENKYQGKLLFREIALNAGAHQINVFPLVFLAILAKLSIPFIVRFI